MSDVRVSYWAQVWQAGCEAWGERDEHVRVSPPFAKQADLVAWARPYMTPGYQVRMIRREVDGNSYKDIQLVSEAPMTAEERALNNARVQALLAGVALPTMPALSLGDEEPF